jgi:hypothetical protein
MQIKPQVGAWSIAAGEGVVETFLPPGAQHVSDGPSDSFGTHHVYRSDALAVSFDGSAFQDRASNAITPGTFDFARQPDVCYIGTGAGAI